MFLIQKLTKSHNVKQSKNSVMGQMQVLEIGQKVCISDTILDGINDVYSCIMLLNKQYDLNNCHLLSLDNIIPNRTFTNFDQSHTFCLTVKYLSLSINQSKV